LGIQALLPLGQVGPDRGPLLGGPGRLDQLGAQVGVATFGSVAPPGRAAAGILRGRQAAEARERSCLWESAPVTDLAGQRQRPPGRAGRPARRGAQRRRTAPGRTSRPGRPRSPPVVRRGHPAPPGSGRRLRPGRGPGSVAQAASAHGSASRGCRSARAGRGAARTSTADAGRGAIGDHVGPGRHRSRTAASCTVGMRIQTSSPARCSRARRPKPGRCPRRLRGRRQPATGGA
jgi:hypothetical protein